MKNAFGALGVGPQQNNRGSRFGLGGIVSGIGGLLGAASSNDAAEAAAEAAQFDPYNVTGVFGSSTFGPGNTATAGLSQPFSGLQNYYLSQTGMFNNQLSPFFAPHPAQFLIPGAPGGAQSGPGFGGTQQGGSGGISGGSSGAPTGQSAFTGQSATGGTSAPQPTGQPNFQIAGAPQNGSIFGNSSEPLGAFGNMLEGFNPEQGQFNGFNAVGNDIYYSNAGNGTYLVPEGTPEGLLQGLSSYANDFGPDGGGQVITYDPDAFKAPESTGNPDQGVPPVQIPSVINFDPFSGLPIFNIAPNANGTPGQALPPGFQNGPITPVLGGPNSPGTNQQTTRGLFDRMTQGNEVARPTGPTQPDSQSGSVPTTTKPQVQGIPGQQWGQGGYPGNLATAGQIDWNAYNEAVANWRSPEQVIYDRLQTLSAPDEALERSSLENRLFAQGMLGSTGGRERTNALLDAQQQRGLQREIQSVGLAESIQNMIQQRGLAGLQAAISLGLLPNDYLSFGGNFGAQQASAGANVGQILANNGGQQANNISAFFSSLGNNIGPSPGVFSNPGTPGFVPSSPVFGGGNPYSFSSGSSGFGIQ